MQNPHLFKMSFNRENLRYSVRRKTGGKQLMKDIAALVRGRKGQTGIVYVIK